MPTSYGFLGTYPPAECSLATFSRSLIRALTAPGSSDTAAIVRVVDGPITSVAPEVVGQLPTQSADGHIGAAELLNSFDVAVVQHEDGIYGGHDGDQLLRVLDRLRVPSVVVMHTVVSDPTEHQEQILREIAAASTVVVTMTESARERLVHRYSVDPGSVRVIRHGADPRVGQETATSGRRPLILTWGLLGPGKGIEWAIDGLQRVRRLQPKPAYIVAGKTHPRVRAYDGENYRLKLAQRARVAGVSDLVRFEGSYLDERTLRQLIRRADVVLLPYDSREQATSGVLVEAVAAGRPVVATAFPHAVELLSTGAGLLVRQYDGAAIGEALFRVLTEPDLAQDMAAEARRLAPPLQWPAVAEQYRLLAGALLADRATRSR